MSSPTCEGCHGSIIGVRFLCIDCLDNGTPEARYDINTVNFCSLKCSGKEVAPDALKTPHNPASHNILIRRTALQNRDLPLAYHDAKSAIRICQEQFRYVSQSPLREENDNGTAIQSPESDLSQGVFIQLLFRVSASFSLVFILFRRQYEISGMHGMPQVRRDALQHLHRVLSILYVFVFSTSLLEHRSHCLLGDGQSALICDDCHESSLLQCVTCRGPFREPQWFYGLTPRTPTITTIHLRGCADIWTCR